MLVNNIELRVYEGNLINPSNRWRLKDSASIIDSLLEDEISIRYRYEYTRIFDFIISSMSISLDETANVRNMLDLLNKSYSPTWPNESRLFTTLKLTTIHGDEFWGIVDFQASSFDNILKIYNLRINDLFSEFYKSVKDSVMQGLYQPDPQNPPVNLKETVATFNLTRETGQAAFDAAAVLRTIRGDDIGTIPSEDDYNNYVGGKMTRGQFLLEAQKNHNAYIFFDGDGVINFVSKTIPLFTLTDITNNIIEDTYEVVQTNTRLFDAALINYKTGWFTNNLGTPISGEGWAFVYGDENGDLVSQTGINLDLSNIPKGFNWIDLRQLIPGPDATFGYREVLPDYNGVDILSEFRDIFIPITKISCKINRLDLKPLQQIQLDGTTYNILEMEKDYITEEADILLQPI
jgi:hypothetical protein